MINLKKSIAIIVASTIFTLILCVSAQATTGTIIEETVNLRSKNSTSSKILEQLDGGDKVEVIGEEGDWYKVSYNSITGYVSKDLIKVEQSNDVETTNNEQEVAEQTNNTDATNNEQQTANNEQQTTNQVNETETPDEQPTNENNNTENPVSEENAETAQPQVNKEEIKINNKYIINSEVEVKIIPLMNAVKSIKLSQNTEIMVIDSMNNWYYVETENNCGWVRKQTLENVIDLKENTQEPQENNNENGQSNVGENSNPENTTEVNTTPENTTEVNNTPTENQNPENNSSQQNNNYTEYENSKTGYISGSTVNFRKEANTSSGVIKKLSKNTEVQILGETSDGWYKVTYKDQTGYVSSKYVSNTKVAETTSRGGSSTQIDTTTVAENKVQEPVTNTVENPTTNTAASNQADTTTQNTPAENTTNSSLGDQIVAYSKTFLGTKYVSGGSSPKSGFDCSGFTKYVYAHFGITVNRVSSDQAKNGVAISKAELIPGDLLIFNNNANTAIGHVGIYIGNNQFIHASNPSDGVKITSLSDSYYLKRYVGARRVF